MEQEKLVIPSDTRRDFPESRQFGSVAAEITSSLRDVLRSEFKLAKVELKQTSKGISTHAAQVGIFGIFALISLLPFMSFLVIGLGRLLNENYWLSSLIVALTFFGVGAGLSYRAFMKIRDQDLSFQNTRDTIKNGVSVFDRKLKQVSESAKRRAA